VKKEFIKVAAATALCIGVFCAGFLGVNNLALAAALDVTENIRPVTTSVAVPAPPTVVSEDAGQSDFQPPELTVIQSIVLANNETEIIPCTNALSVEDAAQNGARYVWDIFGECMDGAVVFMSYAAWPSYNRNYWIGVFAESEEALFDQREFFRFTIDAVTGERIDIFGPNRTQMFADPEMADEVMAAVMELRRDPNRNTDGFNAFNAFFQLRQGETAVDFEEHAQAATEFATIHFANTEVVSVQVKGVATSAWGFDEDGNLISIARHIILSATDCTGRIADIAIDEETKTLIRLTTMHNDIIPGFRNRGPAEY